MKPKRSVLIAARIITAVVSLAGAEGVLWFGGYPNWWRMDPAWSGGSPEYEADSDLGWRARQGDFKSGVGERLRHEPPLSLPQLEPRAARHRGARTGRWFFAAESMVFR